MPGKRERTKDSAAGDGETSDELRRIIVVTPPLQQIRPASRSPTAKDEKNIATGRKYVKVQIINLLILLC